MKMMRKNIKYLLIAGAILAAMLTSCRLTSQIKPSSHPTETAQPTITTPEKIQPGDYEGSIAAGGRIRNYLLHIPPAYDGQTAAPLVIVMHGGGGNAASMMEVTGMSAKADEAGFIVVYPNGTGPISDEKLLTWNTGNCCGYALENNVDDVGFIRALIEKLERELAIDKAGIYATGMSNGGMMSYRLGCELSDKLAAIAPVAGAMAVPEVEPVSPVAVIIFHGTADEHVLYEGGAPKKTIDSHPRVDKPVSYAVDFWVDFNDCSEEAVKETKGNIVKETYRGGRDGTEVVLYTIIGGKHAWPGGKTGWVGGDIPTREISATDLMWDFFKSHPKKQPG